MHEVIEMLDVAELNGHDVGQILGDLERIKYAIPACERHDKPYFGALLRRLLNEKYMNRFILNLYLPD